MAQDFLKGLFGRCRDAQTTPPPEAQSPPSAPEPSSEPVPEPDPAASSAASAPAAKPNFIARLTQGLSKSSTRLGESVSAIFTKKKLDAAMLDALEETLIGADLGVAAAGRVVAALAEGRFDKEISASEVRAVLAAEIARNLAPLEAPLLIDPARKPHVILMTGVNGSGKTTTIGKLGAKYKAQGLNVMLAGGDTFRAAAIEQLAIWGDRIGAPVIAAGAGADAAGLAFEALQRARAEGADVLLIDTAGRLQNRRELMDELGKIVRVLKKIDPSAPHDVVLVLDATVGQNALSQADAFAQIAGVTGLVLTKLDGTARGGVLVALGDRRPLPVHYIGVGEGVDDLQPFRAAEFARALAGVTQEERPDDDAG